MSKNILLCISGGIAAYKTPGLVRALIKKGHRVKTVITEGGLHFVTPTSLATVSQNPVYTTLWNNKGPNQQDIAHIELAEWADLVLVAPATANILAKMAAGIADDLVSTSILATDKPIHVAPAMNTKMYFAAATQNNLEILKKRRVNIIGPAHGELACKTSGTGRMSSISKIVEALSCEKYLAGKKVLITTGATREYLDPVRFLSNPASGKTGVELAKRACQLGAQTTLIAANPQVNLPSVSQNIKVQSTLEMQKEVSRQFAKSDLVIMSAAVGDWRPQKISPSKLKKEQQSEKLNLSLIKNPDILKQLGELNQKRKEKAFLVGFAAETTAKKELLIAEARKKLTKKHCDLIVANQVHKSEKGFAKDFNEVILVSTQTEKIIPRTSKTKLAREIFDQIRQLSRI